MLIETLNTGTGIELGNFSLKDLITRPYRRSRRGGGRWRMSNSGGLNIGGSPINVYPRLGN